MSRRHRKYWVGWRTEFNVSVNALLRWALTSPKLSYIRPLAIFPFDFFQVRKVVTSGPNRMVISVKGRYCHEWRSRFEFDQKPVGREMDSLRRIWIAGNGGSWFGPRVSSGVLVVGFLSHRNANAGTFPFKFFPGRQFHLGHSPIDLGSWCWVPAYNVITIVITRN